MVGGLSFIGSYSGIDSATIDSLIEAESGKLIQYTNKQENITREKTAWNDVNTRLDSLYKKLEELKNPEIFQAKSASSSDESAMTVTTDAKGQAGNYKVQINRLATASRVTASSENGLMLDKTLKDKLDLSGELTLGSSGKNSTTINITAEDSLKDVAEKINGTSKESGVSATIVDNRLVLNSTEMGEKTLSVTGDLADKLGFDSTTVANQEEGKKAKITIDGQVIERNSNHIDDVIEGVTFDLLKVTKEGEATTIKVSEDPEKTISAVKEFVSQYNSTMSFIGEQLKVGDPSSSSNKVGALVGDSALVRLQTQLRSLVTSTVGTGSNTIKNVKDIGITVDRYGSASLDETKLKEMLAENPVAIEKLFTTPEKNGVADSMHGLIDTFVSKKNGIISTKATTYDKMIKDISKQVEQFNERLVKKREYYVKKFTALDTAMMQAESQMNYLMSQMDSSSGK